MTSEQSSYQYVTCRRRLTRLRTVAAAVAASAAIAVVLMGLRVDQMAPVEVLLVREALVVGKLRGCV